MLKTFLQCLSALFFCLFVVGHRTGNLSSPTRHWTRVLSSESPNHCTAREFSEYACVLQPCSHVRLFATLWTVAHQVAPSMEFSRQEYWSGLPCSPLGDLPNPGIETESLMPPALQANSLPTESSGKPSLGILFTKPYKIDGNSVCVWGEGLVHVCADFSEGSVGQ